MRSNGMAAGFRRKPAAGLYSSILSRQRAPVPQVPHPVENIRRLGYQLSDFVRTERDFEIEKAGSMSSSPMFREGKLQFLFPGFTISRLIRLRTLRENRGFTSPTHRTNPISSTNRKPARGTSATEYISGSGKYRGEHFKAN